MPEAVGGRGDARVAARARGWRLGRAGGGSGARGWRPRAGGCGPGQAGCGPGGRGPGGVRVRGSGGVRGAGGGSDGRGAAPGGTLTPDAGVPGRLATARPSGTGREPATPATPVPAVTAGPGIPPARTGSMLHSPGYYRVAVTSTRSRAGPACGWCGTEVLLGWLGLDHNLTATATGSWRAGRGVAASWRAGRMVATSRRAGRMAVARPDGGGQAGWRRPGGGVGRWRRRSGGGVGGWRGAGRLEWLSFRA
jgi:hypothetical protein